MNIGFSIHPTHGSIYPYFLVDRFRTIPTTGFLYGFGSVLLHRVRLVPSRIVS